MILAKILSSYTFRYAVSAVVVLSMVVLFVMVIVYGVFSYNYFHDVHAELSNELNELANAYETGRQQGGDAGAVASVDDFIERKRLGYHRVQFAYLVVDNDLVKVAGNLEAWPKFREYGDGWLSFELGILQYDGDSRDQEFVARSIQMSDGKQVLAARSYEGVLAYIRFVIGILIRGFIVSVSLGAMAAFFMTWALQRRLDTINRSIKTIMSGDLSARIRVIDSSSEIEQLALNLNVMLDRIQYLMEGVKQVSDNIAHDLRTPLTRLRNHLASFEKRCSDEDLEVIRQLIAEADDMLLTFNSLLRIARVEMGESGGEKSLLRLDDLVKDVVELYEPVAAEKDISLSFDLELAQLSGDRNLLFQAVANVVDNAIKYTPLGGRVAVVSNQANNQLLMAQHGIEAMEDCIALSIADSGCGIEEKNIVKVFRRFYREESSRGKEPGNGLGLSLVAAVIKMHGAKIFMRPNNPGLIVDMIFPAYQEPESGGDSSVQVLSSINLKADVSTSTAG